MNPLLQRLKDFPRAACGQMLPVAAFMMVALLALTGLVVDVGNVYLCHRELQASTDAAALAGAAIIPTAISPTQVTTAAIGASSTAAGSNRYNNMTNVAMVSGYPALKCLSSLQTQGISCVGPISYNSVRVVQEATVPLYFARVIGKSSMTISASATAAKGGGSSRPYNIALVLDTTLSMNNYDSDCGNTQMVCTLNGTRQFLTLLDPCGTSQTTCTITSGQSTNSVVRVAIFTFPQVSTSSAGYDSDCSNSQPTAVAYSFPSATGTSYTPTTTTYRLVDFQSDYRLSDTATALNQTSALSFALGGVTSCYGLQPPTPSAGYYGTYYAATIYAAQAALVHEQTLFPNSQNVMIVIGDGDANSPQTNGSYTPMPSPASNTGYYPSYYGQCGQSITAADYANAQGTRVYSVAYGSPSSGCQYDQSGQGHATGAYTNILPCNEMAQIASASYYFFSDFKQSGSNSTCTAPQAVVSLNDIFLQIAEDLTVARLVSDTTT